MRFAAALRRPRVASSSTLRYGARNAGAPTNDAGFSARSSLPRWSVRSSPGGIVRRGRAPNDRPRRPRPRAHDGGRLRDDADRRRRRAAAVSRTAPPLFLRTPALARGLRTLRTLI